MTRDASLDDFLGDVEDADAGDAEDERGAAAGEADDGNGVATGRNAADVDTAADPARATYDWSSAGAACGECGAVVERRWRDGDAMVCGECKVW